MDFDMMEATEHRFEERLILDLVQACTSLKKKTARTMANACYAALVKNCKLYGQDPAWEVAIKRPGEERHFDDTKCWCVVWEAGPFEWAVPASMALTYATGKLVEPYYSFDLCFYPSEDDNG